ncbi:MAG: amidase family protein [Micromonosporaceae bacterium]
MIRNDIPTAASLGRQYLRGVSPVAVLEDLLDRQGRVNSEINAITHVDADGALQAARESAERYRLGSPRGPLDGIPITVKELLGVAGWPHARGSRALQSATASLDSLVVRRLRDAGAVLWAQVTSSELGWKPLGDSPLHGATLNPGWPTLTPGGSSCGSAAVIAAGLGPISIGTDAAGSVRIPAAFCALFALKPSRGTMDLPGSPFSLVATAGPITRTLGDLDIALTPFAPAADPASPAAAPRVGYLIDLAAPDHVDPSVTTAFEIFLSGISSPSLRPEPVEVRPDGLRDAMETIWSAALATLAGTLPVDREELEPGLVLMAERGIRISADALLRAQGRAGQLGVQLDDLFESGYDILVSPTVATPPFAAGTTVPPGWPTSDWLDWIPFTYPFNLSGHPTIAIPVGVIGDVPQSVQLIGPRGGDRQLLQVAAHLTRMPATDLAAR